MDCLLLFAVVMPNATALSASSLKRKHTLKNQSHYDQLLLQQYGNKCVTSTFRNKPCKMLKAFQCFGKDCSYHLQGGCLWGDLEGQCAVSGRWRHEMIKRGVGCYPIGTNHVVEDKRQLKEFLGTRWPATTTIITSCINNLVPKNIFLYLFSPTMWLLPIV